MKLPASVRKLLGLGEEQRSITGLPWDVGGPVSQGPVTSDQALSLVPVFAAVRILAAQIASLPLQSFRKVGDQRTKIPMPSLFSAPSVIGTQFDWIHRCVTSMALRGNAYGLITQRNSLGYPTMIEWLHPDHVQVQDNAFSGPGSFTDPIWYWRGRTVPAEQMVHIPWFTVPYRVKGLSPMEACAAAVLTGVSAQDYTANWFLNGAVPPGVFKNIQKTIDQKEAEEIKSRLGRAIKTRAPLVHGNDWDYSPIAVAAHEAKFIETLKLTATQIANIYGVPPDQVGGDAGASGMTYRNENNSGLDFVKYTLRSWLEPLEEKFSSLLPQPQFVKFNLDAILRADLPTRMASYVEARNIGIMNVDEIRALEDLPPLPDGKGQDYTPLLVQISQSRGIDAAQVKADQAPSTPAVPEPTRLRAVVGVDDAEVLEIDAGPKGEVLHGASAAVALEARRRDPSDPLALERKFDPLEPRRPDGKWGSLGAHVAHEVHQLGGGELHLHAAADKPGHVTVTHGDRSITLNESEQKRLSHALTRSSRAEETGFRHREQGGKLHSTPLYRVTHGGEDSEGVQRRHSIVIAHPNDSHEDLVGRPALSLTDQQAEHLDLGIARMSEARRVDTGNGPLDVIPQHDAVGFRMKDEHGKPTEVSFSEKDWGRISHTINLALEGTDDLDPNPNAPELNHLTVQTSRGPVNIDWRGPRTYPYSPTSALTITPAYEAPWSIAVDGAHMSEVLDRFGWAESVVGVDDLHPGSNPKWLTVRTEGRAGGIDTHPGDAEQLHEYWTKGEGLAKWAESPKPWTTLVAHLSKFMPLDEAKRTATEWFHDVFHFYPGSDLNRVTHGKPPRGKVVGPG